MLYRGRKAKMALVLAAELSWAIVADQIARFAGILAFFDERLGLHQFDRLGILQGRDMHYLSEVLVEAGSAHMHQIGQTYCTDTGSSIFCWMYCTAFETR